MRNGKASKHGADEDIRVSRSFPRAFQGNNAGESPHGRTLGPHHRRSYLAEANAVPPSCANQCEVCRHIVPVSSLTTTNAEL